MADCLSEQNLAIWDSVVVPDGDLNIMAIV